MSLDFEKSLANASVLECPAAVASIRRHPGELNAFGEGRVIGRRDLVKRNRVEEVSWILLLDDHPLYRDGFAQMVMQLRPEWCLYFAQNVSEAMALSATVTLDLAIIDARMASVDGWAFLKSRGKSAAEVPRILISGRDDAAVRDRARASGARSLIAKTSGPETIIGTIEAVLCGETFVVSSVGAQSPLLTPRQQEILLLVAAGHANKEIGYRLNIAERTVRSHLTELFLALRVNSRTQAIIRAREIGLIPL